MYKIEYLQLPCASADNNFIANKIVSFFSWGSE